MFDGLCRMLCGRPNPACRLRNSLQLAGGEHTRLKTHADGEHPPQAEDPHSFLSICVNLCTLQGLRDGKGECYPGVAGGREPGGVQPLPGAEAAAAATAARTHSSWHVVLQACSTCQGSGTNECHNMPTGMMWAGRCPFPTHQPCAAYSPDSKCSKYSTGQHAGTAGGAGPFRVSLLCWLWALCS